MYLKAPYFVFFSACKLLCQVWPGKSHISLSGNIELNPGPKSNSYENFSVCHCIVNSISARNFSKVSLLDAYISLHSFDIIFLSETYLDSKILSHDPNIGFQGCNLIRGDHRSNVKRHGVCIYYKNHHPLKFKFPSWMTYYWMKYQKQTMREKCPY